MNPTAPNQNAEWVNQYTNQLIAIRCIQVPIKEMLWPPKKDDSFYIAMQEESALYLFDSLDSIDGCCKKNIKQTV